MTVTGTGCSWTAATTFGWLHTTNSGTVTGTVTYTVDGNGSTSSRSGTITAGGQTFTVTQSGAPLTLGFALNETNLIWVTAADYPWYGTNDVSFDGVASATSGNRYIPNSASWLQTTVVGPGTLAFWWKVDSDVTSPNNLGSYDYFGFLINGAQQDMIMGQLDWDHRSYYIPPGTNVLTWQYVKDGQYNSAYDRGWLDEVIWTPGAPLPLQQVVNTCGTAMSTECSANPGYEYWAGQNDLTGVLFAESSAPAFWYWAGQTNVTHSGGTAAQCSSIANNLETSMSAVISTATNVSFWWKVSCQTNADFLRFFTNGTLARQISGEVDWKSNYFSLPAGTNLLTWQYQTTNRLNVPQGSNSAWVDQIRFSPTNPPPTVVSSFTNMTLSAAGNCHAAVPDLTGTNYIIAVDSCSSVTITQSPPAGTLLPLGITTVVLTAFDTSGNATRSTNTVLVTDTTPPVVSWSFTNLTLSAGSNCQASLPDLTGTNYILAADNCSSVTVTQTPPAGTLLALGVNTVVLTAFDASGNATRITNSVAVMDVTPPLVSWSFTNLTLSAGSNCQASLPDLTGTNYILAADNCSSVTVTQMPPAGTLLALGVNTVVLTTFDALGNATRITNSVAVMDVTPPLVTWSFTNLTLSAGSNCQASLPDFTGTNYILAADSCSSVTVTQTPAAGTLLLPGRTTVVLTAFDSSGNATRSTNFVTVADTTPPTLVCPADVVASADAGQCSASNVVLGTPLLSDNCGLAVAANDAPGVFPVGTNFVTWTAADASGNTTSKIQIVIITDAQLPRITAPPAVTVTADAGQNYASSVNLGQAVVSDSCGVACVTNDAPAHFPIGTNFVTWTVTNIYGNRNTAAQQVIVNPAPDLPHQATGIVSNGDGTFTISFQGSSNSVYTVQISSNLLDWIAVQTNTSAGDGTWSYTDADAPNAPVRFYRSARP